MDFALSDAQVDLVAHLRGDLESAGAAAVVRAAVDHDEESVAELWSGLAAAGWAGAAVPMSRGGSGLSLVDVAVLQEEMGRWPLPGPFFSSSVFAATAASQLGLDDLLPGIAAGDRRGTVAIGDVGPSDPLAAVSVRASQSASAWALDGTVALVLDADDTEFAIVVAIDGDGLGSFVVDRLDAEQQPMLDVTRRAFRIELHSTPGRRVGPDGDQRSHWRRILDDVGVLLAAESVGAAGRAFDMAIAYAQTRVQFGHPIGGFQAVKHQAADMLRKLELARAATYYAAWASDTDHPGRELAAAVCRAYVGERATEIVDGCIKIHGARGFTWDLDAHLLFRRVKQNDTMLGNHGWQRTRVASALIDGGALAAVLS